MNAEIGKISSCDKCKKGEFCTSRHEFEKGVDEIFRSMAHGDAEWVKESLALNINCDGFEKKKNEKP
jgi:hypothetical protein